MKQALLVIDVQNDYFTGGKNPLFQPELALKNINLLEDKFLATKRPIIYIQHIKYRKNADFFEVGTKGAELHPQLKVTENSLVIEKHFPNSFFETELLAELKKQKIEQLVITGMMTHMCVDSTTRAAAEHGFQPILIKDATATKNLSVDKQEVSAEEVQTSFLAALMTFASEFTTKEFLKS